MHPRNEKQQQPLDIVQRTRSPHVVARPNASSVQVGKRGKLSAPPIFIQRNGTFACCRAVSSTGLSLRGTRRPGFLLPLGEWRRAFHRYDAILIILCDSLPAPRGRRRRQDGSMITGWRPCTAIQRLSAQSHPDAIRVPWPNPRCFPQLDPGVIRNSPSPCSPQDRGGGP